MIVYQDARRTVHRLLLNDIKTNCYIVQRGDEALLVDPTDQPARIIAYLREHGLMLRFMLSTHGHFDHVAAAAGVVDAGLTDQLYLHAQEIAEYKRASSYSLLVFKRRLQLAPVAPHSPELLATLQAWGLGITHAGGHTRGSCYLHDLGGQFIITGDLAIHHKLKTTLFDSRENTAEFADFVERVLQDFAGDTTILPGHGDPTTLAVEAQHNQKWHYVRTRLAA
jgi:hydroxyacylglutathione hydrolase